MDRDKNLGVFWQLKYWYWQLIFAILKLYRRNMDNISLTSIFGFSGFR
jgi:hypothetical protein